MLSVLFDKFIIYLCLCNSNIDTYRDKETKEPFLQTVLTTLLELLPFTLTCDSAGSLQWFFLLLNRVRYENLNLTSESLLSLLRDVSAELKERTNPHHALLRTRYAQCTTGLLGYINPVDYCRYFL